MPDRLPLSLILLLQIWTNLQALLAETQTQSGLLAKRSLERSTGSVEVS